MSKKIPPTRASLTNQELELLGADDLIRLKLSEDEKTRLREINSTRQQERARRTARLKVEEEPLLLDLREVGCRVESVWDLVNTSKKYSDAIPVLLKHLERPYSDRTKEGIARALAVAEPAVRRAWPTLVEQYRNAQAGFGVVTPGDEKKHRLGAKDALACALSTAVTDETLSELIDLIKNRAHGESRLLLLPALRQSKNVLAKQALKELLDDPELAVEIASWGAS